MNGLKLGGGQKSKNSFAFDNQFMDYQADNDVESYNEEEDDIQEDASQSYAKQSSRGDGKLLVQSNLKNNKSADMARKPDEVKRIKKLNNGIEKLSVSILEMKQKYKDLDMEEVLFKKRSEKKESQIRQFLQQKQQQKRKLERKMKKIKERERRKLEESINLQQQEKINIPKKRVEQHLRKIVQAKEKRQLQKQKEAMKGQEVSQMYSRIQQEEKKKKKFHLRKIEEDTKKKIAQLEQEKEYLAKRKQNYKPLDIEKLDEHAQRHDELLRQLQAVKRAQKEQQFKKILESNAKLEQIYRGQNYDYAQEQYEQRKLKRRQPKQKSEKMKNYQQYVRQNFIPKTLQKPVSKSMEIESSRSQSHKQVKRYRYLQGLSYGEVIQNRPLAKSEAEQRKIGNDYMNYMRSLPKRKKVQVEEELSTQDLQLLNNKLNAIVKVKKDSNPLYERSGRKSLEVKISDKPSRDELNMVIKQLRNKDEQMKRKEKVVKNEGGSFLDYSNKHRQINQNIVDNIQRKLNLLSKL